MKDIEKYISENNYIEALNKCFDTNNNYLGILLCHILSKDIENPNENCLDTSKFLTQFQNNINDETKIKVKLLPSWTTSEALRDTWNRMSKGNYTWNNIKIVLDDKPDYFVVINAPPYNVKLTEEQKKKTIVFQMEPYMDTINKEKWGEWACPDPLKFFKVCSHKLEYNNNEWNLKKTYNELKSMKMDKDCKLDSVISTVLSDKYYDPGHIKRIDFVKFLEKKDMSIHVFGSNKFEYIDYKGSLPWYEKDDAMIPYKYVFNCENNNIKNYFTEKLIDGILAECLVFYSGCINIREFIDERAFIYLELSNFEDDYQKIKKAIEDKEWEKRIDIIRIEKLKILDYLQFFPRLERIITI